MAFRFSFEGEREFLRMSLAAVAGHRTRLNAREGIGMAPRLSDGI